VSRFQFVDDTRTEFSVKRLCEILKIQRSSYYKWRDGAEARQQQIIADALLTVRIGVIFDAENGCYGAKRIAAELGDPDSAYNKSSDSPGTTPESVSGAAPVFCQFFVGTKDTEKPALWTRKPAQRTRHHVHRTSTHVISECVTRYELPVKSTSRP